MTLQQRPTRRRDAAGPAAADGGVPRAHTSPRCALCAQNKPPLPAAKGSAFRNTIRTYNSSAVAARGRRFTRPRAVGCRGARGGAASIEPSSGPPDYFFSSFPLAVTVSLASLVARALAARMRRRRSLTWRALCISSTRSLAMSPASVVMKLLARR